MAAAFVSATVTNIGGSSGTFNMPATRPSTDFYVAIISYSAASDPGAGHITNAGWTDHAANNYVYLAGCTLWSLPAGTAPAATYSVGGGYPLWGLNVTVLRLSGCGLFDVAATGTDTGTTFECPTVTTTEDDTIVIRHTATLAAAAPAYSWAAATEATDVEHAGYLSHSTAYEDGPATAGATGTEVATHSGTQNGVVLTAAFKPSPPLGGASVNETDSSLIATINEVAIANVASWDEVT
jgi:hypothetical protein